MSWQSAKGPEGQLILDTLFVELKNPPKTVKFEGLPDNVVPITRHSTATVCSLPNDDQISLSREQVPVLPNFAMTDYSSQGRTRPDNPVDLNSCKTHQSYYTCLSRSASAAGTIIVQGFDPKIITSGASGYLRQEFRELELLDEITKLKYENVLPEHVCGNRRNAIIREFQKWKGTLYVPPKVHPAIQWNKSDPLETLRAVMDSPWQIVERQKKRYENKNGNGKSNPHNGFVATKGSVSTRSKSSPNEFVSESEKSDPFLETSKVQPEPKKQKFEEDPDKDDKDQQPVKKKRDAIDKGYGPQGLIWDGENYSCTYDALFTIFLAIWSQNPSAWKQRFKDTNRSMNMLATGFHRADGAQCSLESIRNKIRHVLNQRSPRIFPYGHSGTNIADLTNDMLRSDSVIASYFLQCGRCGNETSAQRDLQTGMLQCPSFEGTMAA